MDTYSFIFHIRTEDVNKNNTDDIKNRFDTLNYRKDYNKSLMKNKHHSIHW